MTKKSQKKNQKITPASILMGIIGAIVIAIAAYFGIDLGELLDDSGATPTAISQPTQVANLPPPTSADVRLINVGQGFGAEARFWQVYFTDPQLFTVGPEDTCQGGIDEVIVAAVNGAQRTLDIAAFEWSNACVSRAVVDAHQRGVSVRMVVDDRYTVHENEEKVLLGEVAPFQWIIDAGIPFRDDGRSGLMHNKFMIVDAQYVFTGSMNFTPRDTYTNNNNLIRLRAQRAVAAYQQKFDNMWDNNAFGPVGSSPKDVQFTQDGIPVRIVFSPGDPVADILIEEINRAQSEIRFMAFSFTLDSVGQAILDRHNAGVDVAGIFETRASLTDFSQLPPLFCAGLSVYQDGETRRTFHHKVFVIDRTTVLTGSFNFSQNAISRNDENMVIIRDPALAEQYLREFERRRPNVRIPNVTC